MAKNHIGLGPGEKVHAGGVWGEKDKRGDDEGVESHLLEALELLKKGKQRDKAKGQREKARADQVRTRPAFLVNEVREHWLCIRKEQCSERIALAILHGIVERCAPTILQDDQVFTWVRNTLDNIKGAGVLPAVVEAEARGLGFNLPVLDLERDPVDVWARFGIVRRIEEGEAHISFFNPQGQSDPEQALWEAVDVSVIHLPSNYAEPGLRVAWVERVYKCAAKNRAQKAKGRFEPASSHRLVDDKSAALYFEWGTEEATGQDVGSEIISP